MLKFLKEPKRVNSLERWVCKMKYIKFTVDTNICGTKGEIYEEFEDDVDQETLEDRGQELATENAESYDYLVLGWGNDPETEEEQEEIDDFYASATYEYEEVSEEEYKENTQ